MIRRPPSPLMNTMQAEAQHANGCPRGRGIQIGAALIGSNGKILGRGHNMRVQKGDPILHVSRACLPREGPPY